MSAHALRIKGLDAEIKRISSRLKAAREERKKHVDRLYQYMTKYGLDNVEGIPIKKVEPKIPKPRKKKAEKREDAIAFLMNAGIADPDGFLEEFEATQRASVADEITDARADPLAEMLRKKS